MKSAVTTFPFVNARASGRSRTFAAYLVCLASLALPVYMPAQSAAPNASSNTDDAGSDSSQSGSASTPKALPHGFYLQDTSVFSSALFTASSGVSSASSKPSPSTFQTGIGYSFDGGWAKATPVTVYSVLYSTTFISYQKWGGAMDWNQYLSASIHKRYSPRLKASLASRFVLTDDRQFLFGVAPSNSSDIVTSSNLLEQSTSARAVSNLLLTQRDLLASISADVSYEYSPRITVSLALNAIRNQALGLDNNPILEDQSRSTSGSVTGTLAYALSSRQNVEVSLASTKSFSPLDNSTFTSAMAAWSYALSHQWFVKVQAGGDVEQSSATKQPIVRPVGGGTLGYAKGSWQLLLSSTQSVLQIYGAGTGVVWSSNLAWAFAPSHSRWSLLVNGSFDRTEQAAGADIQGWRGSTELRRALTRHISLAGQYAYLMSNYRGSMPGPGLNTQGVRLSLGWSPGTRGAN